MRKLTPLQELFLDYLFTEECKGNVRKAMNAAGYGQNANSHAVLAALNDEILERSKTYLAAHAARATFAGLSIFDDPTQLGGEKVIAMAKEVWDRAGLVKKDGLANLNGAAIGVLILPAKDAPPEEA